MSASNSYWSSIIGSRDPYSIHKQKLGVTSKDSKLVQARAIFKKANAQLQFIRDTAHLKSPHQLQEDIQKISDMQKALKQATLIKPLEKRSLRGNKEKKELLNDHSELIKQVRSVKQQVQKELVSKQEMVSGLIVELRKARKIGILATDLAPSAEKLLAEILERQAQGDEKNDAQNQLFIELISLLPSLNKSSSLYPRVLVFVKTQLEAMKKGGRLKFPNRLKDSDVQNVVEHIPEAFEGIKIVKLGHCEHLTSKAITSLLQVNRDLKFPDIYGNEWFWDWELDIGTKKLRVCKAVLDQWEYFNAIFKSGMIENKKGSVKLQGDNPVALESLVHLLYGFEVAISLDTLQEVMVLADKYGMNSLTLELESTLTETLMQQWDEDAASDIRYCEDWFQFAEELNLEKLQTAIADRLGNTAISILIDQDSALDKDVEKAKNIAAHVRSVTLQAVTQEILDVLKETATVREIILVRCQNVGENIFKRLGEMGIESLELLNCSVSSSAWQTLGDCEFLKRLIIRRCRSFASKHMTVLSSLNDLRELEISHCDSVESGALELLVCVKYLESLSLEGMAISEEVVEVVSHLKGLRNLNLSRTGALYLGNLALFCQLDQLEGLDLSGCDWVYPNTLKSLKFFPNLNSIVTKGCRHIQS